MKDTIYREAAIEETWKEPSYTDPLNVLAELRDRIKDLPSAQPERKTGKWELLPLSIIPPVYKCSACGRHAVWITTGCLLNRHEESYLSDFCPSCGADMRGEQNEH